MDKVKSLDKRLFLGILLTTLVFIMAGSIIFFNRSSTQSAERHQLNRLLGSMPEEDINPMGSPFFSTPSFDANSPNRPVPRSFQSIENDIARQMQGVREQIAHSMQEMDQFQKQIKASKPYTLTSDDKTVTVRIPLKDEADANNYQVKVGPNTITVESQSRQADSGKNGQLARSAYQSFTESFPETLSTKGIQQFIQDNQLVVVIPKQAASRNNRQKPGIPPVQLPEEGAGQSVQLPGTDPFVPPKGLPQTAVPANSI